MMKAFSHVNKNDVNRTIDVARDYQAEVRRRIRDKKLSEERQTEFNMHYIASMLPSAMEMHKFVRFLSKDTIFESNNAYKIVTHIRTHKDKERLEYLLNYKLSAT